MLTCSPTFIFKKCLNFFVGVFQSAKDLQHLWASPIYSLSVWPTDHSLLPNSVLWNKISSSFLTEQKHTCVHNRFTEFQDSSSSLARWRLVSSLTSANAAFRKESHLKNLWERPFFQCLFLSDYLICLFEVPSSWAHSKLEVCLLGLLPLLWSWLFWNL